MARIGMTRTIALILISALVVTLAWTVFRRHQLERGYGQLAAGDSKATVAAKMGRAWKVDRCGAFFAGAAQGCKEDYIYADPAEPSQ